MKSATLNEVALFFGSSVQSRHLAERSVERLKMMFFSKKKD